MLTHMLPKRYIAPAPDFFTEQFEAVGYDEAGWVGSTFGNGTIDEDAAIPGGISGWGSKCLEATIGPSGNNRGWTQNENTITPVNTAYISVDIVIDSWSNWSDGFDVRIFTTYRPDGSITSLYLLNDGGDLVFKLQVTEDGSATLEYTSAVILAVDTKYNIKIKWDLVTKTWLWKLDDVEEDNGVISGDALGWQFDGLMLGARGPEGQQLDIHFDNATVNTDGWQ